MELKFRPEDEAFLKRKLDAGIWSSSEDMATYLVHLLRQDDRWELSSEAEIGALLSEVGDDEGIDGPAFVRELREKYFGSSTAKT